MIAQCPKCKSIYEIDDAHIPPRGRYGRCSVCRRRFFISKTPPNPEPVPPAKAGLRSIKPKASSKQAGRRSLKKPPPLPQKQESRPAPPSKPTRPEPEPQKHTSSSDLRLTRYQRIHKRLAGYYATKDNGYKYEISVFCFAYREIPSPEYVAEEIAGFRKSIEDNQKAVKQLRLPEDENRINALKDEINRHRGMIKIFGDLMKFQKEFKTKDIDVSINQILAVLKDVELTFMRR